MAQSNSTAAPQSDAVPKKGTGLSGPQRRYGRPRVVDFADFRRPGIVLSTVSVQGEAAVDAFHGLAFPRDRLETVARDPRLDAYNVVMRNVLREKQWEVAHGLFAEMRQRALAADKFTYSTLITHFGKASMFDSALLWLQLMEEDRVTGDLILYSNLIELSRKLHDYSKAIAIFLKMKNSGITPDLVAYNSRINILEKQSCFARPDFSSRRCSLWVSNQTQSATPRFSVYMLRIRSL